MSVSSSTTNPIYAPQSWGEGQASVGTIITVPLATTNVVSETAIPITKSLSAGVWAITPNFITTSTVDGAVFVSVNIAIQTTLGTVYNQDFYYNSVANNGQTLDNYSSAIIPVTLADNPLTIEYVLLYNTSATDPTVSGSITFIRIA
jgi:hypothetical protein